VAVPVPVLRIAIVVGHRRLRQAIEDLLGNRPRRPVAIVGRFSRPRSMGRSLGRLAPDVVVASIRTLGREHAAVSAEVLRVSPGSKLVLIHPVPVLPHVARGGIVHLPEDDLARHLWPALERLTGGSGEQDEGTDVLGAATC
jgi:hypothetical protein